MSPSVCPSSISRLVCWLVYIYHNLLKGWEVSLPCSHRSTFSINKSVAFIKWEWHFKIGQKRFLFFSFQWRNIGDWFLAYSVKCIRSVWWLVFTVCFVLARGGDPTVYPYIRPFGVRFQPQDIPYFKHRQIIFILSTI